MIVHSITIGSYLDINSVVIKVYKQDIYMTEDTYLLVVV